MPDLIYDNVRPLLLTEADIQNGPALLRMMGVFGVTQTLPSPLREVQALVVTPEMRAMLPLGAKG